MQDLQNVRLVLKIAVILKPVRKLDMKNMIYQEIMKYRKSKHYQL